MKLDRNRETKDYLKFFRFYYLYSVVILALMQEINWSEHTLYNIHKKASYNMITMMLRMFERRNFIQSGNETTFYSYFFCRQKYCRSKYAVKYLWSGINKFSHFSKWRQNSWCCPEWVNNPQLQQNKWVDQRQKCRAMENKFNKTPMKTKTSKTIKACTIDNIQCLRHLKASGAKYSGITQKQTD